MAVAGDFAQLADVTASLADAHRDAGLLRKSIADQKRRMWDQTAHTGMSVTERRESVQYAATDYYLELVIAEADIAALTVEAAYETLKITHGAA